MAVKIKITSDWKQFINGHKTFNVLAIDIFKNHGFWITVINITIRFNYNAS
jgi:hypothetical protein